MVQTQIPGVAAAEVVRAQFHSKSCRTKMNEKTQDTWQALVGRQAAGVSDEWVQTMHSVSK